MKVCYVHADNPQEVNTSIWRCAFPGSALDAAGHDVDLVFWVDFDVNRYLGHDVVVFQRYCWLGAIDDMRTLKKNGVTVVYDFDDDYPLIQPTNKSYSFWNDGIAKSEKQEIKIIPEPIQAFGWVKDIVDIMTSPSEHLCRKYGARFLPNMPTAEWWNRKPRKKTKRKRPIVGWGGGNSHYESWRDSNIIIPLLNAASNNGWDIKIVGFEEIASLIAQHKNGMKNPPNTYIRAYMKAEQWPGYLTDNFDLLVFPLAGEYDLARSPIKAMEANLGAIPWLASDNGVYSEFSMFGTLVQNTEQAWELAIDHAMKNNAHQKQAALSARNWMLENYMAENNVEKILEAYTK